MNSSGKQVPSHTLAPSKLWQNRQNSLPLSFPFLAYGRTNKPVFPSFAKSLIAALQTEKQSKRHPPEINQASPCAAAIFPGAVRG